MTHRSTRDVIDDLRRGDRLIQIDDEVDPHLEMAEIQRRVYASGGPALWFTNLRAGQTELRSSLGIFSPHKENRLRVSPF